MLKLQSARGPLSMYMGDVIWHFVFAENKQNHSPWDPFLSPLNPRQIKKIEFLKCIVFIPIQVQIVAHTQYLGF